MSISIDEMIKLGKTLPEIQKELRKQVAARDEIELMKIRKLSDARKNLVTALLAYLSTLDIGLDSSVNNEELVDAIINSVLQPFERQSKDVIKKALDSDMSEEDSLNALRIFADLL